MVHNAVSIKSTHSTIQLGIFSYTPLHDRAQRGWNCEKEEKLEGQREESIALPSARPQTSTVVDLAEHFNDSSLPRAFTVPAVARLGQQSVHARSMKQLLNNWASRCAPFCLFFTPLLISHTIVIYVSSSPLLSTRSFTVSFLLSSSFLLVFRSVKKKKTNIAQPSTRTRTLHILFLFFFPSHLDLPLTIANENRRFSSLKNLGGFQVFFFFCFFWSTGNHFASLPLLILKNFWWWREGWGKGRAELVILYQGKKRFLICHCENDEVVALFKWVKLFWFEREGNIW